MNKNVILCGTGGQGIVLSSRLIASAAMNRGLDVQSAETIGMAQKGGSVFSYLRIGENVNTPMIPKGSADIIMGFEPGETVRMLPYLREGGTVVVNSRPVIPTTASLGGSSYSGDAMIEYLKTKVENLIIIDGEAACRKVGSPKVLNIIMLGQAIKTGVLDFDMEEIREVVRQRVKPAFVELNLKALDYDE